MVLMQQVPSSVNSFTDQNPPSKRVYYQIAVYREGACQPLKKGTIDYSVTRSNVVEIRSVGIEKYAANQLRIYPNPASEYVMVSRDEPGVNGTLSLFNLTGKLIGWNQVRELSMAGLQWNKDYEKPNTSWILGEVTKRWNWKRKIMKAWDISIFRSG